MKEGRHENKVTSRSIYRKFRHDASRAMCVLLNRLAERFGDAGMGNKDPKGFRHEDQVLDGLHSQVGDGVRHAGYGFLQPEKGAVYKLQDLGRHGYVLLDNVSD